MPNCSHVVFLTSPSLHRWKGNMTDRQSGAIALSSILLSLFPNDRGGTATTHRQGRSLLPSVMTEEVSGYSG